MKLRTKKTVAGMLSVILGASVLLSGCGSKTETAKINTDGEILPVSEPITLTAWCPNSLSVVSNYSEMECYKALAEQTGITLDFIHPIAGQSSEQFNVMIASGEYPDLIFNFEDSYSGGLAKGYGDGVIYKLNELMDYAPNLNALFDKYPQLKMEASDTDGSIYAAPMIRGGDVVRTYRGLIIRQDYLDKFNLKMPQTIDDWHTVLSTFKANGIENPFTTTSDFFKSEVFVGAYGVNQSYMLDNGTVKWSPYEDAYKDYVQLMADWYKEGLIDPEITTNTQKMLDSKVMNGSAGAIVGTAGNAVGGYNTEMQKTQPEFDMAAAPYPVLKEGDKPYIIQRDPIVQTNRGVCITTACEHPEAAMAYIDYAYSKIGHMLFNFGIEGQSYEMVDGYPKFTEEVTNNQEGLSMAKAGSKYALAFTSGPFVQDTRYGEQFYGKPRQQEACKVWGAAAADYTEHNTNVIGRLTPEEADEIASIENDLKTYADEMFTKWVLGQQTLDNWDKYKEQLKSLGLDRALELRQQAYDRYIEAYPEMKHPESFEVSDYYWQDEAE